MGRFSCFYPHMRYHKSKKAVQQPTTESMHKTSEDFSQDKAPKFSAIHTSLEPLVMDTHDGNPSKNSADQVVDSSSNECYWKSEEINSSSSLEDNMEINERGHLNKSKSLGSGLNKENRVSSAIDSETEQGDGFSSDEPQERNYDTSVDDSDRSGLEEQFDSNNPGIDLLIEYNETFIAESFQDNDVPDHTGVTFRIGDQEQADDFEKHSSDDHAGGFGHRKLVIEKSFSVPNFEDSSPKSGDEYHAVTDQESDAKMLTRAKDKCESSFNDGFDYYKYSDVEKNWTTPEPDKVGKVKTSASWNELPSNDFKIKRITEWVNTIDLDNENSLHEIGETSHLIGKGKKGPHDTGHAANAKLDAKSPIEVAKNYISSLTPASTSAQMVNLGLVVIPFLSAFVSLRVLNLSGNSIVRITAGALPRGLHALNLSKNNISTIEGLRELTRIRVLDLSYNRISRIGHGLASCSSLKELYLAGNKISEVEGLHRLLKLHILDLRFNKISTSKCLGQLAANYSSLQDIRLEGNPAQRNVGDEQLKKYLQSLLPHLVSYNKHTVRAISSKEIADRPVRAAISTAHQFGPRSDHKLPRKGIPSGTTSKVSSSSTRIAHAVSSLKQMKGRSAHLATGGTKESRHRHRDLGEKLLSIQTKLSMHRSRSEGNLGGS